MFPPNNPAIKDTWIANNCSKISVDFGPKKWQTSRLIKRLPNWSPNSGSIWPALSIKIEVQTHFDSIWLYPFSWMFSLWPYFYFCQVAIFWLKKVQFSSQKCNFYLWKILHCNFWKKERKKITQNNKNATLPLYIFCLQHRTNFLKACFNLSFPPTKLGY